MFLTLIVTPIVFAIPVCFISVDLASAYPFDGGMVSWVDIAYGELIGGHNMYWFVKRKIRTYVTFFNTYVCSRMLEVFKLID